ncbi:MAG: thrombospondin type 3 repeat-containing protein [Deltaproteobacteria bacterium]|nr:thrombospondin type 3 repeat-containing protein [Deltaproteobacteria bacterium]
MSSRSTSLFAAAIAAGLLAATSAGAQQVGFALPRLTPAPLASDGVHAERPRGLPHLGWGAAATFDWGYRPLMTTRRDDGIGVATRDVVTGQSFVHPALALGLFDRLTVYGALPIAVWQNGAGYGIIPNRRRSVLGDARLGVRGTILGVERDARLRLGAAADVFAPTGSRTSWTSDEYTRARLAVLLEWMPTATTFVVVNAGVMLRADRRALDMRSGTETSVIAAAGMILGDVRAGLEVSAATGLRDATLLRKQTTPIEVLAVATWRRADFFVTLGAGPGLTDAAGTPAVRVALRVGLAFDGQPASKAPPVATPKVDPRDKDGDGIFDSVDACPAVAGPESSEPRAHGCPDRDHDGVADHEDACKDVAGVRADDPKISGCPKVAPADRDKDGIFDKDDACPDVPGEYADDPKTNGCPAEVEDLSAPEAPKK